MSLGFDRHTGRYYVEGRPLQIMQGLGNLQLRKLEEETRQDPIRHKLVADTLQAKSQRAAARLSVALACDEYETQSLNRPWK